MTTKKIITRTILVSVALLGVGFLGYCAGVSRTAYCEHDEKPKHSITRQDARDRLLCDVHEMLELAVGLPPGRASTERRRLASKADRIRGAQTSSDMARIPKVPVE